MHGTEFEYTLHGSETRSEGVVAALSAGAPALGSGESIDSLEGRIIFREVSVAEEWNATVRELGGGFPQSWEWGEFRRRQGWRPLRLRDDANRAAVQLQLRGIPGLGYFGYAPHGPVFEDEEDLPPVLEALARSARHRGVTLLKVELRSVEGAVSGEKLVGYERNPETVQPRTTLVVKVLPDADEQLKALPKDTRYGVRRSEREGVEVSVTTGDSRDLEDFLRLLEDTARRQEFAVRAPEYYRDFMRDLPAHLVLARHEGAAVAGAIAVTFGDEAYYLFGASIPDRQNLYATYRVQWEVMNVARRAGATRYDMWGGVPNDPDDRGHPLWGVYQFKRKFGGEIERYAGAYDADLFPMRAQVMRLGMRGYTALQRHRNPHAASSIE